MKWIHGHLKPDFTNTHTSLKSPNIEDTMSGPEGTSVSCSSGVRFMSWKNHKPNSRRNESFPDDQNHGKGKGITNSIPLWSSSEQVIIHINGLDFLGSLVRQEADCCAKISWKLGAVVEGREKGRIVKWLEKQWEKKLHCLNLTLNKCFHNPFSTTELENQIKFYYECDCSLFCKLDTEV